MVACYTKQVDIKVMYIMNIISYSGTFIKTGNMQSHNYVRATVHDSFVICLICLGCSSQLFNRTQT